jgi:hypothetical protein
MSKGICSSCGGHGCSQCRFSGTTHADVERLMAKGDEPYDLMENLAGKVPQPEWDKAARRALGLPEEA